MCACMRCTCAFSSASAIAPLRAMKVSGLRGTCGLAIGFFHPAERTWAREDEGEGGAACACAGRFGVVCMCLWSLETGAKEGCVRR